jgi:Rps23 Pro-64 3,4-dihydroxylase Tpa1-like proline 4-hydroxylase
LANIFYHLNKVENYQPVISVDNFFTEEELNKLQLQLKTVSIQAALVGNAAPTNDDEFEKERLSTHTVRKSNVSFLDNVSWFWLYDKLLIAINHVNLTNYNKVLYGIDKLQYAEYDSAYNGFYKPHVDISNEQLPLIRSLSFTIQLSREHEYVGGDVLIYLNDNVVAANKKYGTITFFDSKILHEVTPVTSGFRKSLVGWIVGPRV